jgi:hypothetical protein
LNSFQLARIFSGLEGLDGPGKPRGQDTPKGLQVSAVKVPEEMCVQHSFLPSKEECELSVWDACPGWQIANALRWESSAHLDASASIPFSNELDLQRPWSALAE